MRYTSLSGGEREREADHARIDSLWVNLRAVKRVMDNDGMDLEIIVNNKVSDAGEAVIQLETAVGAAIKHFRCVLVSPLHECNR